MGATPQIEEDPGTVVVPSCPQAARICMFVYNACATDARVLKEAGTLARAGHQVQVIAVLDRTTSPEEERDGFQIVRIDRQPLHYAVLRNSRRVRRFLRLSKARLLRTARRRQRSALRRLRRFPGPVIRVGRAPVTAVWLPLRVYRYTRWRVLQRLPPARRWYYRRRAQSRRPLRQFIYRLRMRQYRARVFGEQPAARSSPPRTEIHLLAVPFIPVAWLGRAVRTGLSALEKRVSHACWHGVMVFHKPLMFFDYYRRAYKHAREQDFDVLHAHDLLTLPVAALLARSTGRPLVYDSHELYTEMSTLRRSERAVWKALERILIGRATQIVTVCDSIGAELVQRYGVSQPLTLLNCPWSPPARRSNDRNLLRAKVGLEESPKRLVLYQGGFAPNRGLEELVEAARYFDNAVLVLMGWGRLEAELREKIAHDRLDQRVLITEPVSVIELLSFTAGADVGVIPYKAVGLNNYYTTPNKLFEYMAAGIPIAASHFPELRRFIEGTGAGLTFDPTDPTDIALAVNGVLADPSLFAEMRRNSQRAGRRYVWERESEKLVNLYDDLLSPSATGVDTVAAEKRALTALA